jgi:predicted enzyme involved in methoxymalonyl-ACP biosynthesis
MISVIICREEALKTWSIDTWLMSCRVLGRGVERMVLREILHHARLKRIEKLVRVYRPTERNRIVRDHYQNLGFTQIDAKPDGETLWVLATVTDITGAPLQVRRSGFGISA